MENSTKYDVVIIGGGAAGLMCAIEAGKRGRSVLVIEHNQRVGEKIRISGGGRCNFTNTSSDYSTFLSNNPDFSRSAFARYGPQDFIALVEKHRIPYHEKKSGQLFCDESSQRIVDMLLLECTAVCADIRTGCTVHTIERSADFRTTTNQGTFESHALVIATGGLSIPPLGATDFGHRIARMFGLEVTALRPGLVPVLWGSDDLNAFADLSGISVEAEIRTRDVRFHENVLFTHRGLSGPAILQLSSYWNEGDSMTIDLCPETEIARVLEENRQTNVTPGTILSRYLPRRVVQKWIDIQHLAKPLCQCSSKEMQRLIESLTRWTIVPKSTEGFTKAEVTVGGIDTAELSSKTMEAKKIPGLYFVGEVVDVTGWLGGYNFQWAWSSGWVAGRSV